jgi:hypothetical protein
VKHSGFAIISPLLCAGLLLVVAAEKTTRLKPRDVEPFHEQAKAAIAAIPEKIGSWESVNVDVPWQATKLLQPNIILSRRYTDWDASSATTFKRYADVLIVQTRDSRTMQGHYPPKCYPANGEQLVLETHRQWTLQDTRPDGAQAQPLIINGMEYEFEWKPPGLGRTQRRAVINFLIVPHKGIVRSMDDVYAASEDYQQRYYGAAQFQVVMSAEIPQADRDRIFQTLMAPNLEVVRTLESGGIKQ